MSIKNRLYIAALCAAAVGGAALYFTNDPLLGAAGAVAGFALGGLVNSLSQENTRLFNG